MRPFNDIVPVVLSGIKKGNLLEWGGFRGDKKPSNTLAALAAEIVTMAFLYIDPIRSISAALSDELSWMMQIESTQT